MVKQQNSRLWIVLKHFHTAAKFIFSLSTLLKLRFFSYRTGRFQEPSAVAGCVPAHRRDIPALCREFADYTAEAEVKQQLSKIHDSSLTTTHSARNLGFIFAERLTFSDQISALSKSCYYHIRELRYIRPYLDFETASTIAILRAIPNQVPNFRPNWAIRGGVMT